jgi:hypothetical protein
MIGLRFVAYQFLIRDWPRNGVVSRTFGTGYVKNHVNCLRDLDVAFGVCWTNWANVDRHALPGRIEDLVAVEQAGYAGFAFAWQELEEGSQVLGTYDLAWKDTV